MEGIYYEARGSGPLLLLIPGGNGDTAPYGPLQRSLQNEFTVVAYDRRGYSRSERWERGDLTDGDRFDQDVADAIELIDEFGHGTGSVFGSSSGAILGLQLLTRHPGKVTTLVAHEPPLVTLLPDGQEWLEFFDEVHATAKGEGVHEAMAKFADRVGLGGGSPPTEPLPQEVREMMARIDANLDFFVEHELRQYPRRVPDLEALKAQRDKVTLASGRESRDFVPYRPNLVLAERLDLEVHEYPGDHIGYANQPVGFARALRADLP